MENLTTKADSESPFKLHVPPAPNWKFKFGNSSDFYFQFYIKKPPNSFQRWMFKKILGITWEPVNTN